MEHSLLFETLEQQKAFQEKMMKDTNYDNMLAEIKLELDQYLQVEETPLTFSDFKRFFDSGSRIEYEKIYFEKRKRLNTFAIMSFVEPDEKEYLLALENTIWSICNEFSWCLPAHYSLETKSNIDLFAAETAFTLAEILSLFKQRLHPLIQKQIETEVKERVLTPFQKDRFGWETWTHNWSSVCSGSVGAAALYLLEDGSELTAIIERVVVAMDCYVSGFHNDGTCLEGYGYWEYGFGYYVYFSDLLKRKTNGEMDLFADEKIKKIALFQQRTFLSENRLANFSDTQATANIFLGLSHYLHDLYPEFQVPKAELRKHYTEDHCGRWAPAWRNLLWYDPEKQGANWENEVIYLPDSAWYIKRTENYSFATKGGHNDEPHNHNDVGHFILQMGEEVFFQDIGAGLYTKDYFAEKRYSFLPTRSKGHSVPIIDGQEQKAGAKYSAELHCITDHHIVIDLTDAYGLPYVQQIKRQFYLQDNRVIMEDYYRFAQTGSTITERMITPVVEIEQTDEGIILRGEKKLMIQYDQQKCHFTYKKTSYMNHFGEEMDCLLVDFTCLHASEDEQLTFIFNILG